MLTLNTCTFNTFKYFKHVTNVTSVNVKRSSTTVYTTLYLNTLPCHLISCFSLFAVEQEGSESVEGGSESVVGGSEPVRLVWRLIWILLLCRGEVGELVRSPRHPTEKLNRNFGFWNVRVRCNC